MHVVPHAPQWLSLVILFVHVASHTIKSADAHAHVEPSPGSLPPSVMPVTVQWHAAHVPSDAAYCAHDETTPAAPATKVLPAVHAVDRYCDDVHVAQVPHAPALPSEL